MAEYMVHTKWRLKLSIRFTQHELNNSTSGSLDVMVMGVSPR